MPQAPAIDIVKSGVFNDEGDGEDLLTIGDGAAQPGETVTYTYVVTNTGNVTLTDLNVGDTFEGEGLIGQNSNLGLITCADLAQGGTLGPGDHTTCTATYTLDQVDIEAPQPIFTRGGSTTLRRSRIEISFIGDGINVKSGDGRVEDCIFVGGTSPDTDAIDFDDVVNGVIARNRIYAFRGFNSDAIDVGDQRQTEVRQQVGQPIRKLGPESHFSKAGTPTMGGALILVAVAIATLLWADLGNRYVWVVLLVTLLFGVIGMRRVRSSDDFATARASYGPLFLAFAMTATTASGATFLGLPGLAYVTGRPAIWVAIGCVAGIGFTVSLFVASVAFPAGPIADAAKMGALFSFSAVILSFIVARSVGVSKLDDDRKAPRGTQDWSRYLRFVGVDSLRPVWILAFLILFQPELRRAQGRGVAGGTAADDHQVVRRLAHALPPQIFSSSRSGCSTQCLTCLRNITASRPSTMRWS